MIPLRRLNLLPGIRGLASSSASAASSLPSNASSLPSNASSLPSNASSLPSSASSLPSNASSLPSNASSSAFNASSSAFNASSSAFNASSSRQGIDIPQAGNSAESKAAESKAGNAEGIKATTSKASNTTHFGFTDIPSSLKESLVGKVFSSVSSKYDTMNDVMSLGLHRLWKTEFVSLLPLAPASGSCGCNSVLDVAGGTGDIAIRILDRARLEFADRELQVKVVDINADMLAQGRQRAKREMYHYKDQLSFHEASAENLDTIPSGSVDVYTISFGIRNCTDIPAVLAEAFRVLRPGGTFACLEFGKVSNPILRQLYSAYSFNVIPTMGHVVAGDRDSYQYLVESIERFPTQPEFVDMVRRAGFECSDWMDMTGGVVSVWIGKKPLDSPLTEKPQVMEMS